MLKLLEELLGEFRVWTGASCASTSGGAPRSPSAGVSSKPQAPRSPAASGCGPSTGEAGAKGAPPGSIRRKHQRAIQGAVRGARAASRKEWTELGEACLAQGGFAPEVNDPLENQPFEEKPALVLKTEERRGLRASRFIHSSPRPPAAIWRA